VGKQVNDVRMSLKMRRVLEEELSQPATAGPSVARKILLRAVARGLLFVAY
jgi:hypothetical protein